MAVVDMLLIIACVLEYSILNVFVGNPPRWYLRAYPYFFHPLKVSAVESKQIHIYRNVHQVLLAKTGK